MSKTTDAAREAARQKYLAALRDLALNLPADDARAIADVYTRQRVIGLARITGTGLHRDGVATTLAVAREATRILQLRRDSANEKALKRQGWDNRTHARHTPAHVLPVWERDDMAERLRRYHEGLALAAWGRAGFREPASRWVRGAGERITIIFGALEGAERIEVRKRKVWARHGKHSANRVERDLILSREWVTNVLRRGITNIFGEGTFVLRARPFTDDPNGLDCILAVQGKGFNVGTENICLRRDETGWFAATRRVGGKWKRTGKEVL